MSFNALKEFKVSDTCLTFFVNTTAQGVGDYWHGAGDFGKDAQLNTYILEASDVCPNNYLQ